MKKLIIAALMATVSSAALHALTIEECIGKAEANYPLIRKYDLLSQTREIDLADINRGWLPRIEAYGQVTGQNVVPSLPESLTAMMAQTGNEIRGLGKIQYKAGIDVSQTIWDGGTAKARREATRQQDNVARSSLAVELYTVRRRVENLYFAILLTEEQLAQTRLQSHLVESNLERMRSMLRNGTAMQSDVDMFEARLLTLDQAAAQARSNAEGCRRMLGIFTGEDMSGVTLSLPEGSVPQSAEPQRPELRHFDNLLAHNAALGKLADTRLTPRIGLFAQAYYGYPGFNYFNSMMNRDVTFNIIGGVRVSWTIDSFYTRNSDRRRTAVNAAGIQADKEVFLFNNSLQQATDTEAISGLREVMKDDARIIELRRSVRQAAESQLANGVIDSTALLAKLTDEYSAELTSCLHQIQLLQEIYNLKYTLNQ